MGSLLMTQASWEIHERRPQGVDTRDFQPSIGLHIIQAEKGGFVGRPSIFSCFREKVAKGSELEKKGPGQKSSKSKSSLAKEWVLRKTVT